MVLKGTPCDCDGQFLPPGSTPPPLDQQGPGGSSYRPFPSRPHFEIADFVYRRKKMSADEINEWMQLLSAFYPRQDPPFTSHTELYKTIDAIDAGDVPWQGFSVNYNGERPEHADTPIPPWMDKDYPVHFRCPRQLGRLLIGNPDFAGEMDYAPKQVYAEGDKREYQDFMSGNWAWKQAVSLLSSAVLDEFSLPPT